MLGQTEQATADLFSKQNLITIHHITDISTKLLKLPYQEHITAVQCFKMTFNGFNKEVQIIDLVAEKNKFACKSCNISFTSLTDLNSHHLSRHKDWKLTCPVCSQGFSNLIDFCAHKKSHETTIHEKTTSNISDQVQKFPCILCGFSFNTVNELNDHDKTIHNSIFKFKFSCKECSECFPNSMLYLVHMRTFHEKHGLEIASEPEPVSNVIESFRQNEELCHQHISRGHPGVASHPKSPEPKFQCEYCPKKFMSRFGLRDHINGKHKGIRFNCKICKTSLGAKRDLRRHLRQKHLLSTEDDLQNNVIMSSPVKMVDNKVPKSSRLGSEATNGSENDPLHLEMKSTEESDGNMGDFEEEIDSKIDIKHHVISEIDYTKTDQNFYKESFEKVGTNESIELDSKSMDMTKELATSISERVENKEVSGSDSVQVDSRRLQCKSCDIVFASKVVFGMHMDISHSQNTFQCLNCQIVFSTKQELINHDCE